MIGANMKTIFLAAGRSSRMDPIRDKNFLEFCGKPLMLHLLESTHRAGVTEFIIVGNYENLEFIKTLCKQYPFLQEAQITEQPRLEEGMAGGILAGLEFCDADEPVLVHNGNDFVDADAIAEVIQGVGQSKGCILGQRRETYFPGGYLSVNEDKRITGIIEKPGAGNEPSDLINIVIHSFATAEALKNALETAKSEADDVYEVALDHLFKNYHFEVVEYEGFWQTIKYPWHVLEMMDLILSHQPSFVGSKAEIAANVTIKGENVYIADSAKIHENAVINGPAYIGEGVIVGNNALVRNACIGENSVVGFNTEVARSWLGKNVSSHIAYIGDSIVDDEVNFGAYSCTANLRLDKKTVCVKVKEGRVDSGHQKLGATLGRGTQIGIGAKLMPGCKTPVGTLIRPGEVWI